MVRLLSATKSIGTETQEPEPTTIGNRFDRPYYPLLKNGGSFQSVLPAQADFDTPASTMRLTDRKCRSVAAPATNLGGGCTSCDPNPPKPNITSGFGAE